MVDISTIFLYPYAKDGLRLFTGYTEVSQSLLLAGNQICVHPLLGYPPDLAMNFYEDYVTVSTNGGYHWECIYSNPS